MNDCSRRHDEILMQERETIAYFSQGRDDEGRPFSEESFRLPYFLHDTPLLGMRAIFRAWNFMNCN